MTEAELIKSISKARTRICDELYLEPSEILIKNLIIRNALEYQLVMNFRSKQAEKINQKVSAYIARDIPAPSKS